MGRKLILGIPNKGRMQKQTLEFLTENGLEIERGRGERGYTGKFIGYDNIDLIFLSPKEISLELMKGSIDLGVTGLDLVNEYVHLPDMNTLNLLELGFGKADVVIAVPISWIDVVSINDLEDVVYNFRLSTGKRLRIATKYPNISRNFFEKIGLSDYLLVDSHGATEGAPAYGSSEIIIDITSTGSTLAANQLKRIDLGTILESQACLFSGLNKNWSKNKIIILSELLALLGSDKARISKIVSLIQE
jgi:ATP phosphoribosyltransferase